MRTPPEKEKVEPSGHSIRPKDSTTSKDDQTVNSMTDATQSVKRHLVVAKTRSMLASLRNGTVFALTRGSDAKLYRRAYSMGGGVVGMPVNADDELLEGPPMVFSEPQLAMVYIASRGLE